MRTRLNKLRCAKSLAQNYTHLTCFLLSMCPNEFRWKNDRRPRQEQKPTSKIMERRRQAWRSLCLELSFGISPALGEATATFPGCHIFGRWLRARGPGYSVALLYEHGDRWVCLGGSGGTPAVGWRAAGCFRASAASCALRPVCLPLSGHRSVPPARSSRPRGLGCSARHRAPLRGFI